MSIGGLQINLVHRGIQAGVNRQGLFVLVAADTACAGAAAEKINPVGGCPPCRIQVLLDLRYAVTEACSLRPAGPGEAARYGRSQPPATGVRIDLLC